MRKVQNGYVIPEVEIIYFVLIPLQHHTKGCGKKRDISNVSRHLILS